MIEGMINFHGMFTTNMSGGEGILAEEAMVGYQHFIGRQLGS
jgi:hypothetical protein